MGVCGFRSEVRSLEVEGFRSFRGLGFFFLRRPLVGLRSLGAQGAEVTFAPTADAVRPGNAKAKRRKLTD